MKRITRYGPIVATLALGIVIGRWTATPEAVVVEIPTPANAAPVDNATVPIEVLLETDDATREIDTVPSTEPTAFEQCVGVWTADTSHGSRVATLRADGTGTIVAQLDWVAALLYGSKLTLEVQWSVVDSPLPTPPEAADYWKHPAEEDDFGQMTHLVLEGQPEENVAALVRDFGDLKEYRVRSFDSETMVTIDPGDGEVITWERVQATPATAAPVAP